MALENVYTLIVTHVVLWFFSNNSHIRTDPKRSIIWTASAVLFCATKKIIQLRSQT